MGKLKNIARHTDAHTETLPVALTTRQENFARLYAETGVAIDAYATAYNADGSSRATMRVAAYRLLRQANVTARVRELQEAAGARSLRSAASLIHDLEDMVEADPNELVRLDVGACRHCYGEHGGFQWRSDAEYARAVDKALAADEAMPSMSGGFGYDASLEPNPDCPECAGQGVPRVKFTSTADTTPGARRLLRGIELFPDGGVKRVLLHDQMAARIELHRLRGLHVDRSINLNANVNVPVLKDMTHEQALDFLDSLKPAS